MPGFSVDRFGGQLPKLDRNLIDGSTAIIAVNIDLRSGALVPIRNPFRLVPLSQNVPGIRGVTSQRVFTILDADGDKFYLQFVDPFAQLELSPILNDQFRRLYFTNAGSGLRYATETGAKLGTQIMSVGIPAPPPFTVSTSGGSGATVTRVYTAVYRSAFGEEGPLSDPVTQTGRVDGTWTVSNYRNTDPFPDGSRNINGLNFYRATQVNPVFRFIKSTTFTGPNTFVDSVTELQLTNNNAISSQNYTAPPANLQGLVQHPGGFLAGFVGRDIYFSEPFVPHAWPAFLTIRVRHEIVGLAVFGESIAVMTRGAPVILTGTSPRSITADTFNDPVPCLANRSIVVYNDAVLYAAPDGLARLDFAGPLIVTEQIIDRESWQRDWMTTGMKAVIWDGNYLALTTRQNGFLLSLTDLGVKGISHILFRMFYDGLDVAHDDGKILMLRQGNIDWWMADTRTSAPMIMRWSSKTFLLPKPVNLGAFQIKQTNFPPEADNTDDPIFLQYQAYNNSRYAAGDLDVINGYAINDVAIMPPVDPDFEQPPGQPLGGQPLFDLDQFGLFDVIFRLFADGNQMFNGVVEDETTYRADQGYKGSKWNFEIVTSLPVHAVHMATRPTDLAREP